MCGIIGRASLNQITETAFILAGRDTLNHRGPDDRGLWWSEDRRVCLAQRRLSIIDLSPAGHQPMGDKDGSLWVTFNGEIYNHQQLRQDLEIKGYHFRSTSDTEVILAAYKEWGTACVERFNGMFAFGLYDTEKQLLFVARDRVGEKPLFYRLADGTLNFASELKALMQDPAFPRSIDPVALDCYLAYGYVPGDLCILQGVNKLPPAHALTFDLNSGIHKIWRYWQLPEFKTSNFTDSEEDLVKELEYLLKDSVRQQILADVPIGILLSGGVDSSLITAMAASEVSRVKTFTICFPGSGKFDETEFARSVSNHFDTEHIELAVEPSTVEILPILARQFDEPISDSSIIPTYMVSQLVSQHCTVALGGDGGDELFGGYSQYRTLLKSQAQVGWIPYEIRQLVANLSTKLLGIGVKGRNWLQQLDIDFESGLSVNPPFFSFEDRCQLLSSNRDTHKHAEMLRQQCITQTGDLIYRSTRMDFENSLPEDMLVKVDRASMLNSLEIRAPFLDYRLIEFAFEKVPSCLKTSTTQTKILPKRLLANMLPPGFDLDRKQGFSIPLASWLKTPEWNTFFRQVLLESDDSFFDRKFVTQLFDGQKKGRTNSERLFSLVVFELWRREYGISRT
jgi:asparagine synthase (glutamine-hydrolysing)